MRPSVENKQTEGHSWGFYTILGVSFNALRAVYIVFSVYLGTDIQTDRHTYTQKVSFHDIDEEKNCNIFL